MTYHLLCFIEQTIYIQRGIVANFYQKYDFRP